MATNFVTGAEPPPPGSLRRFWVGLAVTAATVLAVLAVIGVWADRQLMNPGEWSRTSAQLLTKPRVRAALSAYLVDRLLAQGQVQAELGRILPPALQELSGPLTNEIRGFATKGVQAGLENAQVQAVWRAANYDADQVLVRIINGGSREVQVNNGAVTLNLREIVAEIARRVGVSTAVAGAVPQSAATITVIRSSRLGLVQRAARALHSLAVFLALAAVALYALAVVLAAGFRRETVIAVGGGLVTAGIAVLIIRAIARDQLVPDLVAQASLRPAGDDVFSVATGLLAEMAGGVIVAGLPLIVGGLISGPSAWALAGRRRAAPQLRARPWLAYLATLGPLALLVAWAPTHALRSIWWLLAFLALGVAGAEILRRQIAREFPLPRGA